MDCEYNPPILDAILQVVFKVLKREIDSELTKKQQPGSRQFSLYPADIYGVNLFHRQKYEAAADAARSSSRSD